MKNDAMCKMYYQSLKSLIKYLSMEMIHSEICHVSKNGLILKFLDCTCEAMQNLCILNLRFCLYFHSITESI